MRKKIVSFLGSLKAVDEFFEEEEEEERKFSQYGEKIPCSKTESHHFIHTEDYSLTQQMRGY